MWRLEGSPTRGVMTKMPPGNELQIPYNHCIAINIFSYPVFLIKKMWKLVWSHANYNYEVNTQNKALYVFDSV